MVVTQTRLREECKQKKVLFGARENRVKLTLFIFESLFCSQITFIALEILFSLFFHPRLVIYFGCFLEKI